MPPAAGDRWGEAQPKVEPARDPRSVRLSVSQCVTSRPIRWFETASHAHRTTTMHPPHAPIRSIIPPRHVNNKNHHPSAHPWISTHRVLYIRQRLLSAFPRQAASLGGARFDKALLAEDNVYVSVVGFWGGGKVIDGLGQYRRRRVTAHSTRPRASIYTYTYTKHKHATEPR